MFTFRKLPGKQGRSNTHGSYILPLIKSRIPKVRYFTLNTWIFVRVIKSFSTKPRQRLYLRKGHALLRFQPDSTPTPSSLLSRPLVAPTLIKDTALSLPVRKRRCGFFLPGFSAWKEVSGASTISRRGAEIHLIMMEALHANSVEEVPCNWATSRSCLSTAMAGRNHTY